MINKLMGVLIGLVGVLILAGSAWYAYEATSYLSKTLSTTGEIVDHKFTGGLNSGFREVGSTATQTTPMYAPIVAFRSGSGVEVQFQANWSEGDPPAIGTTVPVRYLEDLPQDARIGGFASLYGGAAILFLIGAVLAGAGGLILRQHGRRSRVGP